MGMVKCFTIITNVSTVIMVVFITIPNDDPFITKFLYITTVTNVHMVTTVTFITIVTNVATNIMAMFITIVTNAPSIPRFTPIRPKYFVLWTFSNFLMCT
jgi:hypothetical protein